MNEAKRKKPSHTDLKPEGWISALPKPIRPYASLMRLDRPIGIWLLMLPGWWGILMASHALHNFDNFAQISMGLFALGAIIMRGAGCIINDLWDIDVDAKVERTKGRPLPSRQIKPLHAGYFLVTLLIIGLVILLSFNGVTIVLGCAAMLPVLIYPLAKRFTWYPQVLLGLTFNFGALMGASAMEGFITTFSALLYLAGMFWTLGYDTIYAAQDADDDALIGIKSTARKFGSSVKKYVAGFYGASVFFLVFAGAASGMKDPYYIGLLVVIAHMVWQLKTWNIKDHKSSLKIFRSNRDLGLIILLAIVAGMI